MVMMDNRDNENIKGEGKISLLLIVPRGVYITRFKDDEDLFSKFDYELEKAKQLLLNTLVSSQDEKDTKSSDSSAKTIKELKEKLAKVEAENRKVLQKNKELTEWKDKHKNIQKELEDKLSAEIREKNSFRNSLKAKETINEKLVKEIERRDRIFELSIPTQGVGNEGVEVREENEVTMAMSPGGHRTYEIKNKQKVPYWIKIERLSPKCWEKNTTETEIPDESQMQEDDNSKPYQNRQMGTTENHINDSSSDESEYSRFDIARKFNGAMLNQSGSGSTKSKLRSRSNSRERNPNLLSSPNRKTSSINSSFDNFPKETSAGSSTSRAAFDSRQNKNNSNSSTPSKASSSTSHKRRNSVSPKRSFKIQKRSSRDSIHSRASSTATNRSSDEKSESRSEANDSLVSNENVIQIPESLRINYGFPDTWELDDCLHGKNFWYDENHAEMNKCLIRLHDDSGSFENRRFVLIEQQGLKIPKTFHLKFHVMRKKIESTRNKRVWLDIRDFNIFSMDRQNLLKYIDKSVTHFSFGTNLYSPEQLRSTVLFEYIFNHLPNLEYLSINDAMLRKLDSVTDQGIPPGAMLPKLKTLRLHSPKFKFSTPFILKILKRAPNLENMYGIPLQCLREIEVELEESGFEKILETLKSVFIVRVRYTDGEIGALNFLADLSTLSRRSSHTLQELDARTFFVMQPQTRSQCMNMLSKILQLNEKTLKKLKLEPLGKIGFFDVPPLKNLTTLQFDMKRNAVGLGSYFPRGFDVSKSFPNLTSIEISLDAKSGKNFSSHSAHNRFGGNTPLNLLMKHFPTDIFIPGVTFKNIETLTLHRFTPFECIQSFSELFPNIRVLRINNSLADIVDVLPLCFGFWPQLQQLILEINTDTTGGNLDFCLSGIDQQKCRILSKAPIIPEQDQIIRWIETHRTKLSICHLTELQLLKFLVRTPWVSSEQQEPIFTQVSALYGFGNHLMPNLKVQLGFDERVTSSERERLLESIRPALEYISLC